MLELLSLEKQVTEYTPPAFIWHTYTDQSVPVQKVPALIEAMKLRDTGGISYVSGRET